MTVQTFDVVAADVAALIGHLSAIGTSTSPTATTTTAWITQISSEVCSRLRYLQYDPDTILSTSTGISLEIYHQARRHISEMVASRWLLANRAASTDSVDAADRYREEYQAWLDALVTSPQETTGGDGGRRWRHPFRESAERTSRWSRGSSYR